jgi:hypothetical protein
MHIFDQITRPIRVLSKSAIRRTTLVAIQLLAIQLLAIVLNSSKETQSQQNVGLTPGAKPVLLSVSTAPPELIKKTAITWGYDDEKERYKFGGKAVYDNDGGVLSSEIQRDYFPKTIRAKISIDYTDPNLLDVEIPYELPVEISGVNKIFSVPSLISANTIYLNIQPKVQKKDYLVFAWSYESENKEQPILTQRGSLWLGHSKLVKIQRDSLLEKIRIPHREGNDGEIKWVLSGILNSKRITQRGKFSLERAGVSLYIGNNSLTSSTTTPSPKN